MTMSTDVTNVSGQKAAEAEPGVSPPARVPSFVRRTRDESFGLPAGQVVGFAVLIAAMLVAFFLFPGHIELIFGVLGTIVGAGKLIAAQIETGENDALPPASRAFRELADPTRPLSAEDPVTIGPSPGPPAPDVGSDATLS